MNISIEKHAKSIILDALNFLIENMDCCTSDELSDYPFTKSEVEKLVSKLEGGEQ